SRGIMMQETTTQSRPLEVGEIEERDVITRDGRIIGHLKGAWIDTSNWTISSLIIDLKKDVVDELNVKKPILKAARINLPTNYVQRVADVIQLNVDMSGLSASLATGTGA
ncbi:MAG TPA: PRC-barrel domain-containing protein, partial [Methanomassiliicoccaceae archaeon]|nr:PRC-barrel domain-containing protein [Methanomassiliicoccaceae archaeon]